MSHSDWSIEHILALAPDPGSAKSGKGMAISRVWLILGTQEQVVWGECQGSAKEPYQTQIDLNGPAFKCSCPSRKFPCKHALGLFILVASQPGIFVQSTPPPWVSEWLEKRSQRAERDTKSKESTEDSAGNNIREKREAQIRRVAKRDNRIRAGLGELELWLGDLVRQGLASVQAKPASFWDAPAARLVDAQAPGLARQVREMAYIPASGQGWQGRFLTHMARIYLALNGYKRLESLPQTTQDDLKTVVGWTHEQNTLLERDGIWDRWLVMGKRVEEEALGALHRSTTMKVQRTWLRGETSGRPALILNFAAPGQVLDTGLVPGTAMEAELVYFPGSFPLRALVKQHPSAPQTYQGLPGTSNLLEASCAYSEAINANPWIDLFPLGLVNVFPYRAGEAWGLLDAGGRFIQFAPGFTWTWQMLALSGGHPIAVFGEWNGETYWPLSAYAGERWVNLTVSGSEK